LHEPQNASNAEIGRPIFDTDIGTEKGPICTGHRVNSLQRWPNATAAKIEAETAAYILSSLIGLSAIEQCARDPLAHQMASISSRRITAAEIGLQLSWLKGGRRHQKVGAPEAREDSGANYDALGAILKYPPKMPCWRRR
jgi:hypothetical protein